jgi:hypothetical protein
MTDSDLAAGVPALKSYVESIDGWEADFVPDQAYSDGVTTVVQAWDSVGQADNSDALDLKYANCGLALYQSISAAGYGDKVTADQCEAAAQAVMTAVLAARGPATGAAIP